MRQAGPIRPYLERGDSIFGNEHDMNVTSGGGSAVGTIAVFAAPWHGSGHVPAD